MPNPPDRSSGPIRLLAVRDTPPSPDEAYAAVGDDAGGTAVSVGAVRDHDGGRSAGLLEHGAHPGAQGEPRRVAEKTAADLPARGIDAVHRAGPPAVGDIAVIAAVSCPHRAEAFAACARPVEDLQHEAPILEAPGVRVRRGGAGGSVLRGQGHTPARGVRHARPVHVCRLPQ